MLTTDLQEELLTEVDKNNQIIGSISRKIAHTVGGKYYRTVYILVKNDQDQILLQKRSATKDLYPNCWDLSVGGHVSWGYSYEVTAVKELKEELGISADISKLKFIKQVLIILPNSFEYFYVYEYRLQLIDKLSLAMKEIALTKWANLKEIVEWISNNPSDWYPRPIQLINSISH